MPSLSISTWNINSVRLRIDSVIRFLSETSPDVLCLQEIKCRAGEFPAKPLAAAGYPHQVVAGQKGWHGVAIVSRLPLAPIKAPAICPHNEARIVGASIAGIDVHNLYVPAGGDIPDRDENPKFAHKLAVLARMRALYAAPRTAPFVLVGDLNVAPGEHDVWSHKQLLDVVSHTPVETEALEAARQAAGLIDLARRRHPADQKLFTWWSYRSPDWTKNNRGRRLDHIWSSPDLAERMTDFDIHIPCRAWDRPSDHVPVVAKFEL